MHHNVNKEFIQLRNVTLGNGRPKVCISLMGKTKEDIYQESQRIMALPCDIIEWRVDWLESDNLQELIPEILQHLREYIEDKPLIFTIRTKEEGGERAYSIKEYMELNEMAVLSECVDMIDVELMKGNQVLDELVRIAHSNETYVIASSHDFVKTPSKEVMCERLIAMEELGADVLKLAVMPENSQDVIALLEVTREVSEEKVRKPVVTMSMSQMGMVSRIAGETFGSAMTFGAGEQVSAPGQIEAKELVRILELLHK